MKRRAMVATLAAAALAAPASRPLAAEGATLLLLFGPNESQGLLLQALRAELDGKEIPVQLPSADADPAVPVFKGSIVPGVHALQVEAEYAGSPSVFSYVEGFRFRMRGQVEFDAASGEVVSVQGRVLSRSGLTVQWQDRYYLTLSGPARRAAKPAEAGAAAPAPAEGPVAPPPPPPPPAAAPPACHLDPVHFAFGKAALDPAGVAALDRFAACLGGSTASVLLEGHCDQRGGVEYNERLGKKRADAAARHLRERGVAAGRIAARSMGKSKPICRDATEACYARNRRVEAVPGQ